MRARNIKPGFFQNERLVELPAEVRLLFIGLWMCADREGRIEDRPKKIKMQVFPADDFNVDSMLNDLESEELVQRYEHEGRRCIWIPNFHVHQSPHQKEVPSKLPPAPGKSNKYNHGPITREQRERILKRDNNTCQHCAGTENLHIDHVVPIAAGGSSDDDNLQVLCAACNTKKRNKVNYEVSQQRDPVNVDSTLDRKSQQSALNPDVLNPDSLNPEGSNLPSLSEKAFDEQIWTAGVELLGKNSSSRSLIGKWVKEYGKAKVAATIAQAIIQRPVEPKAYITAALQERVQPTDPYFKQLSQAVANVDD